ncbi:Single-stranded DNA-binding protein [Phycisphaerae bacterium RAS1]|nr:Single-stranded DNA-binding protein [Phycisphaerae bacterium RAS1]
MASFNRVILMGNMTRDPELKYLPSNMAVCEFGLAVNHRWRDKDGNQKEDVCFVDCACFGRGGEVINQYMAKGRAILIEGRLKLDSWTGQDGQKRSKHSVVVENFQFVGGRGEGGGGGAPANRGPAENSAGGGYERRQQAAPAAPAQDYGDSPAPEEPSRDSSIPF